MSPYLVMSTWTLCVSVMDRPAYGVPTAHVSHFLHMDRTAWQQHMRLIFCTWQCMLLWLLSFVANTVLISEVLRKPSSK